MAVFGHVTLASVGSRDDGLIGPEVLRSVPSLFRLTLLSTANRRPATFAYEAQANGRLASDAPAPGIPSVRC